jgi:hypothetical protein
VGAQHAPLWLAPTLNALAPAPRIADFARGVLDTSHVVYALSVTAFFLALAHAALAARRWR